MQLLFISICETLQNFHIIYIYLVFYFFVDSVAQDRDEWNEMEEVFFAQQWDRTRPNTDA